MTAEEKESLAQEVYENYNLGSNIITDHEGWDKNNPGDFTRVCYAEDDEGKSFRISFHVAFDENNKVKETYALDMSSGNMI